MKKRFDWETIAVFLVTLFLGVALEGYLGTPKPLCQTLPPSGTSVYCAPGVATYEDVQIINNALDTRR